MSTRRADEILSGLQGDRTGSPLADLLCEAASRALPVSGVGLTLMSSAGIGGAVAATDGTAQKMEDLQLSLGEGPCVDASQSGRPVLQPDLAATGLNRWPAFGPAVLQAGVAAIFAFPLQVGAIRLGVLDLYRQTTGNLTDEELAEALSFADAALVIMLKLQSQTEPGAGLHPAMSEPIEDRAEIHQATGMISVQAKTGLTEALLLLRAHAFSAEQPVLDTARDVVLRRLHFAPEDDHHE